MSQQIQITGGAKVRNLEGVLTGTSGVVNALGINVPDGIPQLDGSGKILVSQLPNSVMEYKGTWNASTNTPTLADGTGNAGDVYVCSVAGTVNFGSGPIVFYVGDQVLYSGTIWQRASGSSGSVTSVAVTESGDALTITGSPITTSGTINIGFAGNSGQYVNGAGGLTTFPTDNITGSGLSGQVTYFNGPNTITGENAFNYDASNNRLGVNTTNPNATIGANAELNSGYGLLIKTGASDYNGIGIAIDSTYGNTIEAAKLGAAPARNLTLLNQSGFISLTEGGSLGVNILTPNAGVDIYSSTSSSMCLHTANSGITSTDGLRLSLFSNSNGVLRNNEGSLAMSSEGDFYVITLGAENIRVNSVDGKVGIGNPTTVSEMLTVNGSIQQSGVLSALLKTNSTGKIIAAVAGTDYLAPSALSAYVPYTGATANVNLGTHTLSAYNLIVNHTSGSGVAASITKGGSGEALTVVKSSGSGNAASITGGVTLLDELHLNTDLADAYIASAATWNAKIGGSGVSGRVAYYNGSNSITSEAAFNYDDNLNRFGVNTNSPNATIGANSPTDSNYSLLLKNGDTNYSGIGFSTSSIYGNSIETVRIGTAPSRNLTLYNYAGYVSITENGNFGVNILTPNSGIDIYNSTSSQLWLHNAATGITATDGVRLALFNSKEANLRNFDGGFSISAEGDFQIITLGADNFRINSANGYIGIGNPATILAPLHVYNAENAASLLLQTDGATSYSEIAVRNASSVATSYFRQYSSSATGTIFGTSNANLATFFSNFASNFAIGTLNGGALIFGTSNVARLTIASFGESTFSSSVTVTATLTVSGANQNSIYLNQNAGGTSSGYLIGRSLSGTDSQDFFIYDVANSATRMFISTSGNVAFGTSSPTSRLTVNVGTGEMEGLTLRDASIATSTFTYSSVTGENRIGGVAAYAFPTFYSGGSERMRITSSGDVCIGTSTALLPASGRGNLTLNGSSNSLLTFGIGGVLSGYIYSSSTALEVDARDSRYLDFNTNNNQRMRITTGGEVLIAGTFNPYASVGRGNITLNGSNNILAFANNSSARGYLYHDNTDMELMNIVGGIKFFTAATERMRITSGGNVGIGTSSPSGKLTVNTGTNENVSILSLGSGDMRISALNDAASANVQLSIQGSPLLFRVAGGVEAMRITSGGYAKFTNNGSYVYPTNSFFEVNQSIADWTQVNVNKITSGTPLGIFIGYTGVSPNSTGAPFIQAQDSTALRFLVRSNGGIENYATNNVILSDERLKKDITPLESVWDKFKNIEIVKYKFKDQTHDDFNMGVIAQQVEEVAPELIDSDGWGTLDKDGTKFKGIYEADMNYYSFKALQECMAKIEEQQAQIEELKELIKNK
jgi:hypothetical protein